MSASVVARSEGYSPGFILFELLAGLPPFHHDTRGAPGTEAADRSAAGHPRPQTALEPPVDKLIQRAWAKDPPQRFAGTDEIAAALVENVRGGPTRPVRKGLMKEELAERLEGS